MVSIIRAWRVRFALVCFQSTISLLPLNSVHGEEQPAPSAAKHHFADEVAALVAAPAPASGGILMVGSSIFRRWESCAHDLAPLPVTNRAFGGSRTGDQLFFFDQIVPTSHAALVVWYCGSNDVNEKVTPTATVKNTTEWVRRTRAALPKVRILLVSVIRAPQKRSAGLLAQVDEVNKGLRQLSRSVPDVSYVDVNPALETPAGAPVAECYEQDNLHLTPEAYRRMTLVLQPLIEKSWKSSPIPKPSATP